MKFYRLAGMMLLGVSVGLSMQLRLIRYCLRFIQVALVWFRGFIWIDVIFLKSSLWGVFILIFTLDFEILSTRRNDVAWSFCWTLNAVEINSVLPAFHSSRSCLISGLYLDWCNFFEIVPLGCFHFNFHSGFWNSIDSSEWCLRLIWYCLRFIRVLHRSCLILALSRLM